MKSHNGSSQWNAVDFYTPLHQIVTQSGRAAHSQFCNMLQQTLDRDL